MTEDEINRDNKEDQPKPFKHRLLEINRLITKFYGQLKRFYRMRENQVNTVIFMASLFVVSKFLLSNISYFPYYWVTFLSLVIAALGYKSKTTSLLLLHVTVSLSLIYQNFIIGLIYLLAGFTMLGHINKQHDLIRTMYMLSFALLIYRLEFFPIIAVGLIFGPKTGAKFSTAVFMTALVLTILLPFNAIGHFTLDFDFALLKNPKPPVELVTLSTLIDIRNLQSVDLLSLGSTLNDLCTKILNSKILIPSLIGWILLGSLPSIFKSEFPGNHILQLIGYGVSSYVPLATINYIYGSIPGFHLNANNVLTLFATIMLAWVTTNIMAGSVRKEEVERIQRIEFPIELEEFYYDVDYIGGGGFARVFKAKRRKDGKEVALKIPVSLDPSVGRSFLREITNWSRLKHRNIVELYDANVLPIPYLELELCDTDLSMKDKPMKVEDAARIIFEIAEGLKFAHSRDIIHRDLKPKNILFKGDVPKISDWGLSKVASESKLSVKAFTPLYASPEQVSSKFGSPDHRTDIWQLGVIFYELVTGTVPFTGRDPAEVISSILLEEEVPKQAKSRFKAG